MSFFRSSVIITLCIVAFGQFSLADARPNIDTLSKSVVRVVCSDGTGTGFVVTNDGYILTNNHVMDGSVPCGVLFSGQTSLTQARLIATDADKDISIIKIPQSSLAALTLAKNVPQTASEVWALGYPGNADISGQALSPTATNGPFQRTFRGPMGRGRGTADLVQHGAPVNPGNSGGPLFDGCGNVIGINTFIPRQRGGVSATGIYFGTNITESISMLASQNISVETTDVACRESTVGGGDNTEALEADLSRTQSQLDAAKAKAEEIERSALAAGRSAEEARAEAASALAVVALLQASAVDAEERVKKLQTGILISLPSLLLLLLGVFILALRKPRQLVVEAARGVSENLSRRISKSSSREGKTGESEISLDYDLSGQLHQLIAKINSNNKEGFVVGRNASLSHHVVSNSSISKRHFRVSYKDNTSAWIEDLNSANGTQIKGQQIIPFEKASLKFGSSLIAGGIRFKISKG